MLNPFDETFRDPSAEAPLDPPVWDGGFAELFARLDGELATPGSREEAAAALREVLAYLVCSSSRHDAAFDLFVGRRTIGLAWVMFPELFEGESLAVIAERLGVTRAALSRYTAQATRTFGVRSRGQVHGWNRGRPISYQGPLGIRDDEDMTARLRSGVDGTTRAGNAAHEALSVASGCQKTGI